MYSNIVEEMKMKSMKRNTCKVFNVTTGKLIARNCSYDFAEKLAEQQGAEGGLVTRQNGSFMMMTYPLNMSEEMIDAVIAALPQRDKRNRKRFLRNKNK